MAAKKIVPSKTPATQSNNKKFSFSNITGMIENISKKSIIQIENRDKKQTYISTGIYILDALLSKSITLGGVSKNRITIFAGPAGVGKSYICYNIARNAQKQGFNVIYIDTEFSIEYSDFETFGVDTNPDKFMLIRSNKVEDLKIMLAQLLTQLKEQKASGIDIGKTIIFLDSVGMLASNKEVDDAIEGKNKVDMSRAKAIKSLFRIVSSDLGYLEIPLVATNHIYMSQDLFPQTIMSGGEGLMYSASTIIYLTVAKLKHGDEGSDEFSTGSSGVVVTAKSRKNRLARPKKIFFEIDHEKGTNPFKGLEYFFTTDNYEKVGIIKGKIENGKPIETGNKYYVRHLDKSFFEKQLFNKEIFTDKVIDALEDIIYEYFRYGSFEEMQEEISKIDKEHAKFEGDSLEDDFFDKK